MHLLHNLHHGHFFILILKRRKSFKFMLQEIFLGGGGRDYFMDVYYI